MLCKIVNSSNRRQFHRTVYSCIGDSLIEESIVKSEATVLVDREATVLVDREATVS